MSVRGAIETALGRRRKRWEGGLRRKINRPLDADTIASYELMRGDNASATAVYRAGAFWEEINRDFRDLIWAGALSNLRNQYFNRRFSGPDPADRQIYCALMRVYRKQLEPLDTRGFLARNGEPDVGGNADQELVEGRPVSLDFLQSVEEAYTIDRAWASCRSGQPLVFVELGAGYGRLAYVVRKMFPDAAYVILDLPEALMCSSSWLSRALPGEVVPYAESRNQKTFTRENLKGKVWTLGAHQIEAIAPNAADVFVNIYSFAEMPETSIRGYFSQIDRITDGILYTKQRKRENNLVDKVVIVPETYPIRPDWRELFHRDATLRADFFESAWEIPRRG